MPSKQSSRVKKDYISSNNVKVYARIRKVDDSSEGSCINVLSDTVLTLQSDAQKFLECKFAKIFNNTVNQNIIFDQTAKPMIDDLVDGKNGLLFTYGVTNSGKTYTMTGTVAEPGLLPRSLDMIFNSIMGLQTRKYTIVPDEMNWFNVQTDADAFLEKQERDFLPTLKNSLTVENSKAKKEVPYDVEHCYSEKVDINSNYTVFVSYVEIYNENIFDLLADDLVDSFNRPKPLMIKRLREDKKKNMFVYNANQVEVQTTEEAFRAFQHGQERRRVAHTQLNAMSSRSHSIFNIRLVQVPLDPLGEDLLLDKKLLSVSQLSLVDLAGSERMSRTGSRNDRRREAGNINNSLMTLRTCFAQLHHNQLCKTNELVKYRNSKLTHLFKNFFEGHGTVKMILCLNPNTQEYEENFQVLQFAEIAKDVGVPKPQSTKIDYDSLRKHLLKKRNDQNSPYCFSGIGSSTCSEMSACSETEWESLEFNMVGFPNFQLEDSIDSETLPILINYLQNRIALKNQALDTLSNMSSLFRKNIANGSSYNKDLQSKMMAVEGELNSNSKEVSKLERQVKKLESKNQILTKTAQVYQQDKKLLHDKLSDIEMQLKHSQLEKQRIEAKLPEAIQKTKVHLERVCDKRIRLVKEELGQKVRAKEDRLMQLRNILVTGRSSSVPRAQCGSSSLSSGCSSSTAANSDRRRRSKSEESMLPKKRSKIVTSKSSSLFSSRAAKVSSRSSSSRISKSHYSDNNKVRETQTYSSLADNEKTTMIDETTNTLLPRMIDVTSSTIGPKMIDEKVSTFHPRMIDEKISTMQPKMIHEKLGTALPKMHDEYSNTALCQTYEQATLTTPNLHKKFTDRLEGEGDSPNFLKEQENYRTLGCRFVNKSDEHNFRHRPAPPVALNHRRSCTSNSSWVAHVPNTTIQPETILQPCIKPNSFVNIPSPKDIANANNYLLTHQCEDTDGELETQLVKGEVFHTRTGGQQVRFVDVETLKQHDPMKQSSSDSSKRTKNHDSDESTEQSSWTDVETRCAFGIGSATAQQDETTSLD